MWFTPLLIALNFSAMGGEACPELCGLSAPQQTGDPSSRTAQVWDQPLLMA